MASLYLDLRLDESKSLEYRAHLSWCADCRDHLDELRQLSFMLKSRRKLDTPQDLHHDIMASVRLAVGARTRFRWRVSEWLLKLNPLPISYAAGAVISAALFTLMLLGFKPIPIIRMPQEEAIVTPVISSYPEYQNYNDLPSNSAIPGSNSYYELPRVLNNSALVSFSQLAQEKAGTDGMWALVEVGPDGRARLVEMLDDPHDPYLIEELWWFLGKPTFQPALVKGRAVSTRIVLLVEKMDISG